MLMLIMACGCTFASETEYCIQEAHMPIIMLDSNVKQHLPQKRGKEQVQDLLSQITNLNKKQEIMQRQLEHCF
jgi:hypothetical protein